MPNQGKAPFTEHNNYSGGRSGATTPKLKGPIKSTSGNPTKGGGINRPTSGKGG